MCWHERKRIWVTSITLNRCHMELNVTQRKGEGYAIDKHQDLPIPLKIFGSGQWQRQNTIL